MSPTGDPAAARFTPAEGAARLAGAARATNTLAALPRRAALFVACKLAHEGGWRVRGSLCDGFQRSLFVTRPKQVESVAYEFRILTDLTVSYAKEYEDVYDWFAEVENKQVIVTTASVAQRILDEEILGMESINIMVVDCCHQVTVDSHLQTIMDLYNRTEESSRPRILAVTFPIFIQDNMRDSVSESASDEEPDETPLPDEADAEADEKSAEIEENVEKETDIPSNLEKFRETNEIIEAHLAKSLVGNLECIIVKDCDREISRKVKIIELNDDDEATCGENVDECVKFNDAEAEKVNLNSEYNEKLSETKHTLKNDAIVSVQLASLQELENTEDISEDKIISVNICRNYEKCLENGEKISESVEKVEVSKLDNKPSIEEVMEAKECCEKLSSREIKNSSNIDIPVLSDEESFSKNSPCTDVNIIENQTVNGSEANVDESNKENVENSIKILEKSRCESQLIRSKMDGEDIPYRIYERLECKLRRLENLLYCKADLAEDMEGIKRLTITKPRELIVEYDTEKAVSEEYKQLEEYMRTIVGDALEFLSDHRYDPTEIYGEDAFSEELRAIPDPTADPKEIFHQFLYVLDHLGPYGADKAAFSLLAKLEKLKVKIPYERHFLLLCLCMSVFLKVRSAADLVFQKYPCDYMKIKLFCKPKILRLAHLLEQFKPCEAKDPKLIDISSKDDKPVNGETCAESAEIVNGEMTVSEESSKKILENNKDETELETKVEDQINLQNCSIKTEKIFLENSSNDSVIEEKLNGVISDQTTEKTVEIEKVKSNKTVELIQQLDKCDFVSLGNRIADKVNTYACNLAEISEETPESSGNFQTKVPLAASGNRGRTGGRSRGRGRGSRTLVSGGRIQQNSGLNPDALCGVIFVQQALMAKVLFMLIVELSRSAPDLWFLCAQYSAIEKPADPVTEPREAEQQRKKQEEVLKKFRMHECNLLLATSAIEEGIDLPRCNLVLRWDPPNGYRSYGLCRARARAPKSVSILFAAGDGTARAAEDEDGRQADRSSTEKVVQNLATYFELDQMMCRASGCGTRDEVCPHEEAEADALSELVEPYRPGIGDVSVGLRAAVALVNRYCSKLPSDTFTRLAATWSVEQVVLPTTEGGEREAFICTLRLPINCPVKYNIVGHPMSTRALARRMVALQACRILHMAGELDDQLMPIGKETFKALEMDGSGLPAGIPPSLGSASDVLDLARPGTTKRRQYYYKRTAWSFSDCRPVLEDEPNPTGRKNLLYAICSRLCCPLPERYNTRGRRLHAPESAKQGLAILTSREIKKIPAFPVYTRSGEVRVSLRLVSRDARLSAERARLAARFMRFTFADVLRVTRHRMEFDGGGGVNDMYIVPTVKVVDPETNVEAITIDWAFLELITSHVDDSNSGDLSESVTHRRGTEKILRNPLLKEEEKFEFDGDLYREAVVTPWYRNQDQPQYFFVAEICNGLSPRSAFPSTAHGTFEEYYRSKYGVEVTQPNQPLLDVDHTSARLNLLTPRYVNRKGVALPVSSERTRRARRDCLDQKQILLPELCRPHPFQLPLWWAAVTLPCILYRINALLIADEIRRSVAIDVGVGIPDLTYENFQWPPLHFGWSLLDVLAEEQQRGADPTPPPDLSPVPETTEAPPASEKTVNDILAEKEGVDGAFEIGMWSNEMANSVVMDDGDEPLPANLTFCTSANGGTNWGENIEKSGKGHNRTFSMADSDVSYMSSDFDTSDDSDTDLDTGSDDDNDGFCSSKKTGATMGVRIEFKTNGHEAEAIDVDPANTQSGSGGREEEAARDLRRAKKDFVEYFYREREEGTEIEEHVKSFRESVERHKRMIYAKKLVIPRTEPAVDLLPNSEATALASAPNEENACAKDKNFPSGSELNTLLNGQKPDAEENTVARFETGTEAVLLADSETKSETRLQAERESVSTLASKNTSSNADVLKPNLESKQLANPLSETKPSFTAVQGSDIVQGSDLEAKLAPNFGTEPVLKPDSETTNSDALVRNPPLNDQRPDSEANSTVDNRTLIQKLFPFTCGDKNLKPYQHGETVSLECIEWNKRVLLRSVKRKVEESEWKNLNCFSMKDVDVDSPDYVDEKVNNVGFDGKKEYEKVLNDVAGSRERMKVEYGGMAERKTEVKAEGKRKKAQDFDFDYQPNLLGHAGPSPSVILQALTMSNANDGINLERLETIGDSFLKYAITAYLYCARPGVHEGKLSHMRSRQVSNHNLYRLGRSKRLGARMIASKFEPHDNWLPPCHTVPRTLAAQRSSATMSNPMEKCKLRMECLEGSGNSSSWDNAHCFIPYNLITQHSIPDKSVADCVEALIGAYLIECGPRGALLFMSWLGIKVLPKYQVLLDPDHPYVKMMEQATSKDGSLGTKNTDEDKIESKSRDCEKSTIEFETNNKSAEKEGLKNLSPDQESETYIDGQGQNSPENFTAAQQERPQRPQSANLSLKTTNDPKIGTEKSSGPVLSQNTKAILESEAAQQALQGLDPSETMMEDGGTCEAEEDSSVEDEDWTWPGRLPGSLKPFRNEEGQWVQEVFGELRAPPSPLLRFIHNPEEELERMLSGYSELERTLGYQFRDRSLLLQAMTHASHAHNTLTDCYQRLEFLGDAILDYLITRHLYEDKRRHSPGALTDLRSALVNNTIFATLAVRHGFHKYFRHMSPGLNEVLARYVRIQEENGHSISEEHYLIQEDELEQAEDVEVPKALGDLFESVAGAIFLDSGMSLSAVWRVYHALMSSELEAFSAAVPKSPVRELLEAEPETAKFGKPERLADGRRVRVSVEVFGRGTFRGVGRNYRIAKGTAARCALRHLAAARRRQ